MSARPIVQRVLLTNDDGIDAPGLAILEAVAAELAHEVWVIAPEHDQSGTSHSISLHSPLRVSRHGERRFGVQGTPGDCVVMAARHLMKDAPPRSSSRHQPRRESRRRDDVLRHRRRGHDRPPARLAIDCALPDLHRSRQRALGYGPRTGAGRHPPAARHLARRADLPQRQFPRLSTRPPPARSRRRGKAPDSWKVSTCCRDRPAWPAVSLAALPARSARNAPDSETAVVMSGRVSVTPLHFDRTDERTFATLATALERGA